MPAIPPHDTGVVERPWDGPGSVAAAPNDRAVLRHMHTVFRGGDPDAKGSYALPHHSPRRGSPAVLAAVRNALARLPQTQGLSDAERAGAERHLRNHLSAAAEDD